MGLQDAAKNVAAYIPGAKFEVIKGMRHSLPELLIDALAGLIVENAKRAAPNGGNVNK